MDKHNSGGGNAYIFKYASLSTLMLICSAPIVILILVSIYGVSKHGHTDGLLGLALFLPFFLILGAFVVLGKSDVILDEKGVSRRLLGWEWCSVSWDNVELVRVVEVSGRAAQFGRSMIAIVPAQSVPGRKSRNIVFSKDVDEVGKLVTEMNRYIAAYRIPVERRAAGTIIKMDHV